MGGYRRLGLALALSGYLSVAQALGVGPIEVHSALNQPLDAVIPITRASPEELRDLTVSLAPLETFQQLGLEITPALRRLRFQIKRDERGTPYIQITSRGPIKEPFLSFVVALEWPKGRLLREYTVLLDPPLFDDQAPPPEVPLEGGTEVLSEEAFSPPQEGAEVGPATVSSAASVGGAESTPFQYGPVRPGETLSTIAQRVHPDGVTLEQMMIALYRANPQAFYDNINLLKAGSVLRLQEDPRQVVAQISPDEARAEVIRQYQAWKAKHRAEPALVAAETGVPGPAQRGAVDARLELVAPEAGSEDSSGGVGRELLDRIAELEKRLALADETAAAAAQENEALAKRVAALEEQVASLQRLLALRDAELARMGARSEGAVPSGQQQALAVGEGKAGPPVQPSPVVDERSSRPSLWQDPVVLASLVGGGSLLILGGWFLWYRRRAQETDEEWTQTVLSQTEEAGSLGAEPVSSGEGGVPSVPSIPEEEHPTPSSGLSADGEIDPVAEADVYLAYGDYNQARSVLEEALETEPKRLDLLLKRLEIAHQEQDVNAFCSYAERVLEALGEDTDRPEWARVKTMGEELVPDHPWFREATQLMESTLSAPASSGDVANGTSVAQDPDEVTLFAEDSDLTRPGPPPLPAGEADPHEETAESPAEEPEPDEAGKAGAGRAQREVDGMESPLQQSDVTPANEVGRDAIDTGMVEQESEAGLTLHTLDDEGKAPDVSVEEVPPTVTVASELELHPLEEEPPAVEQDQAQGKGGSPGHEVAEEEFDGNAFFVFSDEIGTKLDLARAYIEMGDKRGARELLEEVLDAGDETQQAEARELLRHIA